ncbi:MAG: WD40/YVTN/BNR-like repeat-containing protein, partial [Terriglobales bacterium]
TSALRWRSVGPFVGGRATSVSGIASQPNVYFMATAGGGIWETKNAGLNWKNISDRSIKTGNIGAIAVAPSNPDIIYAGAGDSADRNTILTAGPGRGGVYKSSDGGKTWTQMGLADTGVISWIVVDPHNPDVVYAAAFGHVFAPGSERGVYKSSDGGTTWKKVLYVNDHTAAAALSMDPQNPQVVYASMWQVSRRAWGLSSGGPGSGIYKTTDGGANWTNITHRPGLPEGILGNIDVAVAPSEPNVLYAVIQANYKPGLPGGLFRSSNGGESWALMNDSLEISQRAYYYGRVYVDPKDANTVYLPNVGVFVSHDGGKTLIPLRPPHGDNHVFWINPDNAQDLIEGNDGGATISLDGGKRWSSEDNQPTGQFYHANLDDQFPFHIYGAQQDEGSSEAPSAVPAGSIPAVWTRVAGGEECWVVPVPTKPWITYSCGYFSINLKDNRRTGETREVSPWPDDKNGSAGSQIKYRWGWNHHAAATSPTNPHVFVLAANVLFETQDGGTDWKQISPDLTRNDKSKQIRSGGAISKDQTGEEMYDTISAVQFSPLSDKIIWAGSDDGLVHVTTDGGAHWSAVRPPSLPDWAVITCIEASHTQPGAAYLSASRYMWNDWKPYVYHTTDYGKTWTAISAGLPENQYVNSIRQDPNDPNLLLAGTALTVYMSLDGGGHWMPLSLNLPRVRVNDIEIQPAEHAVVLATFGRAYWVLDNLHFLEQLNKDHVRAEAAYVFPPEQTWLLKRSSFSYRGGAGGQNGPSGATVFFHLPAGYSAASPTKLSFTDASGAVINSFSLPETFHRTRNSRRVRRAAGLHAGMNRFEWNLRYPDATDVNGVLWSVNGASEPLGPEVVPGTYYVQLTYGGHTTAKQPFVVKLDPRLHASQAALQQRFALMMRIYNAENQLDSTLNEALAARSKLAAGTAGNTNLSHAIDGLVNLRIQSSEGGLMFRARLHAWLTNIGKQVDQQFEAPTPGMVQVADMYIREATAGVARLQAALAKAKGVSAAALP